MSDSRQSTESMVLLLTQHQQALFRYIFALAPSEADARDILQETSLAIVRKFDEYDREKPFLPWASRFAYFQVLKWRERIRRGPPAFSEDVIELLHDERSRHEAHLELRLRALDECVQKLPEAERRLVTYRYDQGRPTEEIMAALALSRRSLFRALERVRRLLHECVTGRLRMEGAA